MNLIDEIMSYLGETVDGMTQTLGVWTDETPGDKDKKFISIAFQNSPRPGVISQTRTVELFIVSRDRCNMRADGLNEAFNAADKIYQRILSKPSSSCFAHVNPIAGIIGPRATPDMRQVYLIPLEITY